MSEASSDVTKKTASVRGRDASLKQSGEKMAKGLKKAATTRVKATNVRSKRMA